jgi:hypothetical protein
MTAVAEPLAVERPRDLPLVGRIAGWALAVRAGLWAVGLVATGYLTPPFRPALFIWTRWDAPHYLDIARYGYASKGPDALWIAFFPVYPLLVRIASIFFVDLTVSGLVVSFITGIAVAYVLAKLVMLDGTELEGRRAALLLFAFPTAYFLSAPYSEGIFLFSVIAAIYAARQERWVGAGLFAALATASRLVGIAVLPALAIEALWPLVKTWRESWPELVKRLAAISVGVSGTITYLAINYRAYGDPLHFLEAERGKPWFQHAVWPWQPLIEALQESIVPSETGTWFWYVYPARLIALALAVGVLIWGWRRLRASDHVFAWTALGLSMLESRLISLPRYVLALYPIPIIVASKVKNRTAFTTIVVCCFALQAFLFSRYALALWAF